MSKSLDRIAQIVDEGLCHCCGSCSAACPRGIISPGVDYFPRWEENTAACVDCGMCVKVCPGAEFSYPEHCLSIFGLRPDPAATHGFFLKAYLAHAVDAGVRHEGTSGGIGALLPLFLMEQRGFAGAISVGFDEQEPWKPKAFIAEAAVDLLRAGNSKYPVCAVNHLLGRLRRASGRYVFTGLPCQIHGLRKLCALDRSLEQRIGLVVGLFCHSALEHQAIFDALAAARLEPEEITAVRYRLGKLPGYISFKDGRGAWRDMMYPRLRQDQYRPNAKEWLSFLFKFYSPVRCRLCPDATAEFADISLGDPWIDGWRKISRFEEGWTTVLARTERGLEVLQDAKRAGVLVLDELSPESAVTANQNMVRTKRPRAFAGMAWRALRGKAVPEYHFKVPFSRWRGVFQVASRMGCGLPAFRKRLLEFMLSWAGRRLMQLNSWRRRRLDS